MRWNPAAVAVLALGVLGVAGSEQVRLVAVETPRRCTRIAYFSANRSEGQLAIDYAPSEWSKSANQRFVGLSKGQRWRWGEGFWTLLDTQLDLRIAGVEVPSGYYYLVLERAGRDAWHLVALDPGMLPFKASQAVTEAGGIEVPLNWERDKEPPTQLAIELRPVDEHINQATLTIRWGAHKLTAPIDVGIPPGAGR